MTPNTVKTVIIIIITTIDILIFFSIETGFEVIILN